LGRSQGRVRTGNGKRKIRAAKTEIRKGRTGRGKKEMERSGCQRSLLRVSRIVRPVLYIGL